MTYPQLANERKEKDDSSLSWDFYLDNLETFMRQFYAQPTFDVTIQLKYFPGIC